MKPPVVTLGQFIMRVRGSSRITMFTFCLRAVCIFFRPYATKDILFSVSGQLTNKWQTPPKFLSLERTVFNSENLCTSSTLEIAMYARADSNHFSMQFIIQQLNKCIITFLILSVPHTLIVGLPSTCVLYTWPYFSRLVWQNFHP